MRVRGRLKTASKVVTRKFKPSSLEQDGGFLFFKTNAFRKHVSFFANLKKGAANGRRVT